MLTVIIRGGKIEYNPPRQTFTPGCVNVLASISKGMHIV